MQGEERWTRRCCFCSSGTRKPRPHARCFREYPKDRAIALIPKSRTAREIAWLIVREESVLADGLEKGTLEWQEVAAPGTMKEVLAAYDKHHRLRHEKAQGLVDGELGTQSAVHVSGPGSHERERFRQRLGLLPRHHSSSRAVVDVSPPNGFDGAADLWAERRRANELAQLVNW